MFKATTYRKSQMVTLFINRTRSGHVQLSGKATGSAWTLSFVLQGVSPEAFVAGIKGETEMPEPTGVLASFSRHVEGKYEDLALDVEFKEDGRCCLTNGEVCMTFRWSKSFFSAIKTQYTSFEMDGEAVTYAILVEGSWPEASLTKAKAQPRRPYKDAAQKAAPRVQPSSLESVIEEESATPGDSIPF